MSYWACARLEQNRARLAHHFLELAGFATYYPQIRAEHRTSPEPLFIGYTFVAIELQWHRVNRTPGVIRLIMDGDSPAKVPTRVIDDLKAREHNGLVQLPAARPAFLAGDNVRVVNGPFRDLVGVYEGMAAPERCRVLLELFNSQRSVELNQRHILRVRPYR